EEEIVAAAHRQIRRKIPAALTVIAPRHPTRGADIRTALTGLGFGVAQRSLNEPVTPATDIYLADTLNELGIFYRVAPVAFLGGSLIPHGGQNPIEPARLDTVILHGPHVHNFEEVYAAIDSGGGAIPVKDAPSLASEVTALLENPAAVRRKAEAAERALRPLCGAMDRTIVALAPYLGETGNRLEGARPAALVR